MKNNTKFDHVDTIIIVIIVVVSLLVKIYGSDLITFWGDELSQHSFRSYAGNNNFYQLSQQQQQPPLAYLIADLSTYTFGFNEIGIRSYNYCLSIFFLVVFYVFLRKFAIGHFPSLTATVLIGSSTTLFHYGIESRSGHNFAFVFLIMMIDEIIYFKDRKGIIPFFGLFIFSLLFLFSLGLQPPVFLLTLIISGFFCVKDFWLNYKYLILIMGLAGVLFLPLQLDLIFNAGTYLKHGGLISNLQQLLEGGISAKLGSYPIRPSKIIAMSLYFLLFIRILKLMLPPSTVLDFHFEQIKWRLPLFLLIANFLFKITISFVHSIFIQHSFANRYVSLSEVVEIFVFIYVLFSFIQIATVRFQLNKLATSILDLAFKAFFYSVFVFPTFRYSNILNRGDTFHVINRILTRMAPSESIVPLCVRGIAGGCWMFRFSLQYSKSTHSIEYGQNMTNRSLSDLLETIAARRSIGRRYILFDSDLPTNRIRDQFPEKTVDYGTHMLVILVDDKSFVPVLSQIYHELQKNQKPNDSRMQNMLIAIEAIINFAKGQRFFSFEKSVRNNNSYNELWSVVSELERHAKVNFR